MAADDVGFDALQLGPRQAHVVHHPWPEVVEHHIAATGPVAATPPWLQGGAGLR